MWTRLPLAVSPPPETRGANRRHVSPSPGASNWVRGASSTCRMNRSARVFVVGRDVGRAEESLTVTTLADLDPATIDMKCLVMVCASGTRLTDAGQVWTPRFVP